METTDTEQLDPEVCRRARLSRDPRFDGEFFLAVRTTGIYCRPVCPARPPAEKNVRYYRNAAQAAREGFRPCLRCRPESAPNSPAWRGTATTVGRALGLIEAGALNEGTLEQLAQRLGVGERYLRKLFQRELGVSPQAVAHNQRLLFARKLLAETDLPITQVAFAAGFGSVRRFNSAVRETLRATPGELRARRTPRAGEAGVIRLALQYRAPYDYAGVMDFFARHALEGIERVEGDSYHRHIELQGERGWFRVRPQRGRNALQLELQLQDPGQLMPAVARIRRMFDLDANPAAVQDALGEDAALAVLLRRFPGIRSPVQWSLYESAVRAVAGQQVSIAAARGVISRLAGTAGDGCHFPAPAAMAGLADSHFPMPGRRRDTLRELSRCFADSAGEPAPETLAALRGIGPWTVAMIAMRGLGDPDIFPAGDLGLVKAWEALPGANTPLMDATEHWRPWRSYAANLLWRSLGT